MGYFSELVNNSPKKAAATAGNLNKKCVKLILDKTTISEDPKKCHANAIASNYQQNRKSKNSQIPEQRRLYLWLNEAITYLGLDRLGLKEPTKAIHRLVKKGALHPKKISGRLCFDRAELDKVLANGDHKRGKGRPRKN